MHEMLGGSIIRRIERRSTEPPKRGVVLLAAILTWVSAAGSLFGAGRTHIVTNLQDGGPGSLRQEIRTARAGDLISFAVRGSINLTNGELLISKNLTIAGPGATNLAVSAQRQSRVLEIVPGAAVSISALTICNGRAADGAAGTSNSPTGQAGSHGGGIYNAGLLSMEHCIISNCAAGNGGAGFLIRDLNTAAATNWIGGIGGGGGAIYNAGALVLTNSVLTSNSSGIGGAAGGATQYGAAGSSGGCGGAIYNAGRMTLSACAFEHNTAGNGGAAYSLIYGTFDGGKKSGRAAMAGRSVTMVSRRRWFLIADSVSTPLAPAE